MRPAPLALRLTAVLEITVFCSLLPPQADMEGVPYPFDPCKTAPKRDSQTGIHFYQTVEAPSCLALDPEYMEKYPPIFMRTRDTGSDKKTELGLLPLSKETKEENKAEDPNDEAPPDSNPFSEKNSKKFSITDAGGDQTLGQALKMLVKRMQKDLKKQILPDNSWVVNTHSGFHGNFKFLYLHMNEYLTLWGSPTATSGYYTRLAGATITNYILEGKVHVWEEGQFVAKEVGRGKHFTRKADTSYFMKSDGPVWMMELGQGDKTLFRQLTDHLMFIPARYQGADCKQFEDMFQSLEKTILHFGKKACWYEAAARNATGDLIPDIYTSEKHSTQYPIGQGLWRFQDNGNLHGSAGDNVMNGQNVSQLLE